MNPLPYSLPTEDIFCSIRWQHRPIGLLMSVTKTLLMAGWCIHPLKTPFVPDLFLSPDPQETLGVRRKPVLAAQAIPMAAMSHFFLDSKEWLWARCRVTGQVGLPVPPPGARQALSQHEAQQQLLCPPAVPALFVHFQRGWKMLLNPSLDHNWQQNSQKAPNPCTARTDLPVLSCEKDSAKPQQSP